MSKTNKQYAKILKIIGIAIGCLCLIAAVVAVVLLTNSSENYQGQTQGVQLLSYDLRDEPDQSLNGRIIETYDEYTRLFSDDDHWSADFFDSQKLLLATYSRANCSTSAVSAWLMSVEDTKAEVLVEDSDCGLCAPSLIVFAFPINRSVEVESLHQTDKKTGSCKGDSL